MKNMQYILNNIDTLYSDKTNEFRFYVSEIVSYYIDNECNFELDNITLENMVENMIYYNFTRENFNVNNYIENEFEKLV